MPRPSSWARWVSWPPRAPCWPTSFRERNDRITGWSTAETNWQIPISPWEHFILLGKKKLKVEEECRWFIFKKWRFAERFWFKISSEGGLEVFPHFAYFSSPLLKRKQKKSVFTDLRVAFVNQCCQRYHFRRKKGESERKKNTLDSIEPPKTRTGEVIPDCFLTWKCYRINFISLQYF